MLICAVGDLLLDVVVRLDGPIAADTDTYGQTSVGAGGQAANVAAWASALGGRGRFLGKRARDPAGRIAAAELAARGVELAGPEVERGTGTVVSIAGTDGSRSMLSDRGVATELAAEEVDPAWLEGCDWLHVPGYSLVRQPLSAAATRAAKLAGRVSVDASSVAAIDEVGPELFRELVRDLQPEVVFANEAEADLLGPLEGTTIVVHGNSGCRVGDESFAAVAAEVVDTTGAGDAFAAGYLLGGPQLALEAAARCVGRMGAMP
ncbi:MAG TPA: carbohydrate kinase family protein [Gaiellaceae bacterium]|nr:carbohydrate kinase family protein [Gaiellaceae bacterium]